MSADPQPVESPTPATGARPPRSDGAQAGDAAPADGGRELLAWLERARLDRDGALSQLLAVLFDVALAWAQQRLQRLPGGSDDAFDVAQEVAIRISLRLEQCRATCDREVIGWTMAITRRAVADLLRSPAFRHERLLRAPDESLVEQLDAAAYRSWVERDCVPRDAANDPSWLDADEVVRAVDGPATEDGPAVGRVLVLQATCSAYGELPEITRRVLRTRLMESVRWQDVGEVAGISSAAAKRRFQRAQASVRRSVIELVEQLPEAQRATAIHVLLSWQVILPVRRTWHRSPGPDRISPG